MVSTNGLQPLSTTSPTCDPPPLSAPMNGPPSEPGQLQHMDGITLLWLQGKHVRRFRCTCPNCTSGFNSKAGNPDGTPRKKLPLPQLFKGVRAHTCIFTCIQGSDHIYVIGCTIASIMPDQMSCRDIFELTQVKKLFNCTECGKHYMRSDHLKSHVKTHLEAKKKNCLEDSPEAD